LRRLHDARVRARCQRAGGRSAGDEAILERDADMIDRMTKPSEDVLDPVVEAYKKDVDLSLLRRNLGLTVEERLAFSGSPERRHALEVAGLGEHVEGLHAGDAVAGDAQREEVADLRLGVARHVDDRARREGDELGEERG